MVKWQILLPSAALRKEEKSSKSLRINRFSEIFLFPETYEKGKKLPKKRESKEVLISKYHWDTSRGLDQTENENYYTVPQAIEKFGIGRSHLYDLIRAHKLPKIKRGQNISGSL